MEKLCLSKTGVKTAVYMKYNSSKSLSDAKYKKTHIVPKSQEYIHLQEGSGGLCIAEMDIRRSELHGKQLADFCQSVAQLVLKQEDPDLDTARSYIQTAIEHHIYHDTLAIDHRLLAQVEFLAGNFREARNAIEFAIIFYKESGNKAASLAVSYQLCAEIEFGAGNLPEAREAIGRAIAINEEKNNIRSVAVENELLAAIEIQAGNLPKASSAIENAIIIHQQTNNQASLAADYHQFAQIAFQRGNFVEARRTIKNAIDIDFQNNNHASRAIGYRLLAQIALQEGDLYDASNAINACINIHMRTNNQNCLAVDLQLCTKIACQEGRLSDAEIAIRRAIAIHANDRASLTSDYETLAQITAERKQFAEAEGYMDKAVEGIDTKDSLYKSSFYNLYHAILIRRIQDVSSCSEHDYKKLRWVTNAALKHASDICSENKPSAVLTYIVAVRHYAKTARLIAYYEPNGQEIMHKAMQLCNETLEKYSLQAKHMQYQHLQHEKERLDNSTTGSCQQNDSVIDTIGEDIDVSSAISLYTTSTVAQQHHRPHSDRSHSNLLSQWVSKAKFTMTGGRS